MNSSRLPNRWGIAIAAVIMQICLGAVYGWSVFKIPLMRAEHWSETQVQLNFTLAIFFLGVGTIIGGLWQDKVGPRKVATVAGLIYGVGYMLASVSATHHSLYSLYIAYGVLTGVGMGMGYICPVATLVKWFPERRGLMTGVAVCGYGAGALIMSPVAAREILAYGVPATFWSLGMVYLLLVVAAAQFYANPPQGWRPAGWEPRSAVAKAATTYDYTVRQAMATWQFWLLWAMLFLNVSAGIMIISQASPMAQQLVGMTPVAAAGMVGLISIFNGTGRVFWAWVSDHLGRARVYFLLYALQVIIFFSLPRIHNLTWFSAAFALIGLCYGGGFGTMPSFTADFFGAKYMGGIYGIILLAWGAAAIPSPIMIARLHEATGRFDTAI
ncbi:MAG TPA: OFA family MFS transporter, partial [Terriglobales bacterium]|nr:OFA family MFS transporter [Terriglobales bacterium]